MKTKGWLWLPLRNFMGILESMSWCSDVFLMSDAWGGSEMTTVVNKYKVNMTDSDIVYIGRGSVWGNPFTMKDKSDDERTRVVQAYRQWLWLQHMQGNITREMLLELEGKRLACYCAPKLCHGDILVKAISWVKGETV